MHRQSLLNKLAVYKAEGDEERQRLDRFRHFVTNHADCFERSLAIGHITGAAWVLDTRRSYVLLTHHRKLNKWLQLGGHADGEGDLLRVALREACEESGLSKIKPLSDEIFDLDIHEIPVYRDIPAHFHFDVRFLFEADRNDPLQVSDESHEVKWIRVDQVPEYTKEPSILRMLRKSRRIA